MIHPSTYKRNEKLAKSLMPNWRIAQTHNLDHFEKAGFPVRINDYEELYMMLDTMQENRFDKYIEELNGLTKKELEEFLNGCFEYINFQRSFFPDKDIILPISTLISSYTLKTKIFSLNPKIKSLLEIGPGCGYLSFFLGDKLKNYSQIEACESLYILQSLVNFHCFREKYSDEANKSIGNSMFNSFFNPRADLEIPDKIKIKNNNNCTHYPWWRIGELISKNKKFDIVTSNANLLEFNPQALDDYLSLINEVLTPEGYLLVQCTGYPAGGTVENLLEKIKAKNYAPLFFWKENDPINISGVDLNLKKALEKSNTRVTFTTNNAIFVKSSHKKFKKYSDQKFFNTSHVTNETEVISAYFSRSLNGTKYSKVDLIEIIEKKYNEKF